MLCNDIREICDIQMGRRRPQDLIFFYSSVEDLVKKTNNLSLKRAGDLVKFFQHNFCVAMVSSGNT